MVMTFDNVEAMIQHLDRKAIEHGRMVYGIALAHSTKSIEQVEIILSRLHGHFVLSKSLEGLFGLAMFYGAFVGEVIRRNDLPHAYWTGDASGRTFPSLRWHARYGGDSIIFPMSWCYRRIIEGPANNISVKYQACVMRDEAFVETIEQLIHRDNG